MIFLNRQTTGGLDLSSWFHCTKISKNYLHIAHTLYLKGDRGYRGSDRMIVGFITTYAISAYHPWCCVFESWSERGVQHYVIKFVSEFRYVSDFLRVLQFPPPITWPPQYNCNIVKSGIKQKSKVKFRYNRK